ncbi:MAG: HD domain-containing protein [Bacillota bacterium]|nr:HD domain-containing protein [Bacillota bacterium]
MFPDRKEAEKMLAEAETINPGPWGDHSRMVAKCAQRIAVSCGMDGEKAYILGLLHDIGRRYGVTHLAHVTDGYKYLIELGYDEAAKVCITHSFGVKNIDNYIGNRDISQEDYELLLRLIETYEYDDYDRLIQLCDSIAFPDRIVDLKTRMDDVERRYGAAYPLSKRQKNYELKEYFEEKMGRNLYEAVMDCPQK